MTGGDVYEYDEEDGWEVKCKLPGFDVADATSVTIVDLDGDGDGDLVVTYGGGRPNVVYENLGPENGGLCGPPKPIGDELHDSEDAEITDINDDGIPDIVIGNEDGPDTVYLGEEDPENPGKGTGDFTHVDPIELPGSEDDTTSSVTTGDIDGDGDVDIIVGCDGCPNTVYINDGDENFEEFPLGPTDDTSGTQDVEMVDVDGDDIPDVVIGNDDGPDVVYLSDGDDLTPEDLGKEPDAEIGDEDLPTEDIEVEDVNGDGCADFVIATSSGANKVIYCDGGNDKDSLPELENEDIGDDSDSTTVHVHDVDGDGDKDTVFGNSDQTATTYYKDGTGGLEEDPEGPTGDGWEPEPPATTSVGKLTPDPDGDGPEGPTTGMVTGGDVYEWKEADDPDGTKTPDDPTDDTGSWEKVPDEEGGTLIDFVVDETTGVEFVDVDGDGDDDIVVTTEDGKPSVVYENKDGRFPDPPTPIGDELYGAQDVEVVDINGDGIKDIIVGGNSDGPDLVYLGEEDPENPGQGTGDFSNVDPVEIPGSDDLTTSSIEVDDIDGDGDKDIVVGNKDGPGSVFLNDGDGTSFSEIPLGDGDYTTQDVEMVDVNDDGIEDIVIGNSDGPDYVYLSEDGKPFTPRSLGSARR